jgi:hypothetical protein
MVGSLTLASVLQFPGIVFNPLVDTSNGFANIVVSVSNGSPPGFVFGLI